MSFTRLEPTGVNSTASFTFANVNVAHTIRANNFFYSNGAPIGSGSGGSGGVAITVSANEQPNITSVGTLTSLTVEGPVDLGPIGNITIPGGAQDYVLSTDGSGHLNWLQISTGNPAGQVGALQFNDNGVFNGSGNLTFDKTTNTLSVTNVATENIQLNSLGNGQIAISFNNDIVGGPDLLWEFDNAALFTTALKSNGYITVTGNITSDNANLGNLATANYFKGSGNNLSNIQGSNVIGAVASATVAASANSVAGANVTGSVASATVASSANSVAGANVTGAVSYATTANSVAGANVTGTVASATVAASANSVAGANVTGTVSSATVAASANSVAVANVTGIGNIATINKDGNASNILYGNGVFASAPVTYGNSNVATYLASYGSNTITTTGNVSVGNIIGNGQALTGINGSNVTGQVANALVAGTVYTAAQPNITSVGTLTSVTVSGDGSIGGNLTITGNLTVSGTQTTVNSTTVSINDINIVLANNATTAAQANGAGFTVNGANANILYNSTSNAFTFSHPISANGALLTSLAGANVTGQVGYAAVANSVAAANVSGLGNLALVSKDGNASNILYGNGVFASAPVTYGNANVAAYLPTYTGNITANNITATNISYTGSMSMGSGNGGTLSGANLISANYFSGSGNLLSNIQVANVTGLGNLALVNKDGNASNVLYGNGVFAPVSGYGNSNVATFLANLGSNIISSTANIVTTGKILGGITTTSLTNPVAVFSGSGATYSQLAVINPTGTGSADITTYGNNGDDTQSWADIGFTGNAFNDANYTVTGAGDGYFFTQGNASFGGNMVIATGATGTTKDIVFATGGFLTANIKARLYNANGVFSVTNGISTGNLTANVVTLKKFNETVLASANTAASISPDVSTGTVFRYTANAAFTFSSLTNAVAGTSATVVITQDATGGRVMTSTMKFAGGLKTLSTVANAVDIISVFYDGTTYYASLAKGFA